jgi:hypothetical protein
MVSRQDSISFIAQVIVPAVRKFAAENQGVLLKAERRGIHNELATLEREIEDKRAKLEERQRELTAVTEALSLPMTGSKPFQR